MGSGLPLNHYQESVNEIKKIEFQSILRGAAPRSTLIYSKDTYWRNNDE